MDRMARLAEAGSRALLRERGIAAAEDLCAPLELPDRSNPSLSTPPPLGDASRKGARQPEDHLGCCVAQPVRPALVAQPEHVCESLLDVVKAEEWELEALRERQRHRRLPGPGRPYTTTVRMLGTRTG